MNENKRVIKNTFLIAIGNMGAKLVAFLLLPLYTSVLSTTEYGSYDYIITIGAFLLPIVTMSMHEGMFRFIIDCDTDEERKTIISQALFTILFGVVCSTFIFVILSNIFTIEYWQYMLVYLVASVMYIFSNSILRGLGLMKQYAFISCFKNCLQVILNVIAITVLHLGLQGLLLSICISEVVAFFVTVFYTKLWTYIKLEKLNKQDIVTMLNYSIPLIFNSVGATAINMSDRLIINGILGTVSNGIYAIAYKFPSIIETLYHYFYSAWSESASRCLKQGIEKAKLFYNELFIKIDRFIFSIIILLISFMPIIFRILIRGDFKEAYIYIPILVIAIYFDCISKFFSGIMTAIKETKYIAKTTGLSAIINVGLNLLFISEFGLYAAALSTLISFILLAISRYLIIRRFIDINLDIREIVIKIIMLLIILCLYDYQFNIKMVLSIIISLGYFIIYNYDVIKFIFVKVKKINLRICRR